MSAENPTPAGLSPERLAEWRVLADAATPGPWGMYDDDTGRYNIAADLEKTGHGYRCRREICQLDEEPIDNDPTHADWTAEDDDDQVRADGEFIAAARLAVPELLAEVERLQGHFDTAIKGFNASALEIFELRAERDEARARIAELARRLNAVEHLCSGWSGYHTITVKALLTAISDADDAETGKDTQSGESTRDAELTVYRAQHDSIVMGLYTTAAAARQHCETVLRREWPNSLLDWIEDEEDGVAELVAETADGETETGYVVTPLTVASAYDEEADQ